VEQNRGKNKGKTIKKLMVFTGKLEGRIIEQHPVDVR